MKQRIFILITLIFCDFTISFGQISFDSIKLYNFFESTGEGTGGALDQIRLFQTDTTKLFNLSKEQVDSVNHIMKNHKMKKLRQRKYSSQIYLLGYQDGQVHYICVTYLANKLLIVDFSDWKDYWIKDSDAIKIMDDLIISYCPGYFERLQREK